MKFLNVYLDKFLKLSTRERLLLLLAVAAVLYFAVDTVLLTPQQKRIKQLTQSAQSLRQEKDVLNAKLITLEADQAKLAELRQRQQLEIAQMQEQIAAAERYYMSADQRGSGLSVLLQELLANTPNVAMTGLKTQPSSVFFSPTEAAKSPAAGAPPAAGSATPAPAISSTVYRSGLEVSLKGSFPDLVSYLKALEGRSDQLFWASARLDVATYPQGVLKLDIATLGSEANGALN